MKDTILKRVEKLESSNTVQDAISRMSHEEKIDRLCSLLGITEETMKARLNDSSRIPNSGNILQELRARRDALLVGKARNTLPYARERP